MVALRLSMDLTWYVPTWVLLFFGFEIYAFWTLLEDFAILDIGRNALSQGHDIFLNIKEKIPKYKST